MSTGSAGERSNEEHATVATVATVVDRPPSREPDPPPDPPDTMTIGRPSSPALGSNVSPFAATASTSLATPRGALDHSEVIRTRNFCYVGIVIAIAGLIFVPVLPGNPVTTRIFMTGILIAVVCMVYLLYRTRSPETFYVGHGTRLAWFVPVLGVTSAIPFFGPMSPATILLPLGIFFNGLSGTPGVAIATYAGCALMQGVTGLLVAFGAIEDPGFIRPPSLGVTYDVICQFLIQVVLAGTFVVARASRKSSLRSLAELEKAVRAVAQREALLEEARAELRRAVGSTRGRFSEQLIGNYQLGDLIGQGAMGEVYQGVDTRTNEEVAVKMLSRASLGQAQHVERFFRELQTTPAIQSPHVVRVIAVGEQPLPHLVMERLRGRDLGSWLKSRGTLDPSAVIDLVRQVGDGLTAAAEAGVVHRDIKPQNLYLAGTTWKILDFGVSRIAAMTDTLTAGHVVGTPAFMAPEQARGAKIDHRADVYALAAVAYRALTGHLLFKSEQLADTLYKVVHTPPRRPSWLTALPADVDAALAIGLAKRPQDRFASARELAEALAAAFEGKLSSTLRQRAERIAGAWQDEDDNTRR